MAEMAAKPNMTIKGRYAEAPNLRVVAANRNSLESESCKINLTYFFNLLSTTVAHPLKWNFQPFAWVGFSFVTFVA